MSTQPSSRLRPSTFGTSRKFVRYMTGAGLPSFMTAAASFTAFPRARPNFSADDVMVVLQNSFLSAKSAIDLVGDHEIVAVDAESAAGIHHFIGGGGERHRTAERAAEIERQQHVLLLQGDVGERHLRHFAVEDERSAITEHWRGGDALEQGIERHGAVGAAFLRSGEHTSELQSPHD